MIILINEIISSVYLLFSNTMNGRLWPQMTPAQVAAVGSTQLFFPLSGLDLDNKI